MFKRTGPHFFCKWQGYAALLTLLAITCVLGCLWGSSQMSLQEFVGGLFWQDGYYKHSVIIHYLRVPRVLAGLMAGIGLSVSGVLLQSITNNGLAGPNIIGINSGAGFSCILMLSLFPKLWFVLPFAAFAGAFGTTLVIIAIAHKISASGETVILSGIACTAVLNAGISFLSLLDSDVLSAYNAFSIGGLNGVGLDQLLIPAAIIGICLITCLILSRQITLLCLGDPIAASLGVRTGAIRTICLVCASASAASVVSFAGLLGFVGLVVPHIARRLCRGSIAHQLPVSSMVGAIIVILADLLGRTVLAPTEIPVGILMALIGAPFFLFLLLKRRSVHA